MRKESIKEEEARSFWESQMGAETTTPKVVDLGWANGWKGTPMIVQLCRQADHKTQSTNLDKTHHGLDTKVSCDKCGYVYRYDSSD